MKKEDETEVYRLTDMLKSIDEQPLSAEQISHLKRLGIEPDENNDM
ncbi:MAG: hypothetical protein ABSB22_21065 [Thermodesulfobacteriota bacterium]